MNETTKPKCPGCERVLINRLVNYCLYCGETIPEELQLTDQERAEVKEQQKEELEERRRLREEKEKEQEAEKRSKRRDSGGGLGKITDFLS